MSDESVFEAELAQQVRPADLEWVLVRLQAAGGFILRVEHSVNK